MALAFDLLEAHADADPLCPDQKGERWLTAADLWRDIEALGARLGQHRDDEDLEVAVVASDRYSMLVACLCIWSLGKRVVLPPNPQPRALLEIMQASGARLLVSDVDSLDADTFPGLIRLSEGHGEHAQRSPTSTPSAGREPKLVVEAGAPVLTVFTSGTTGVHQRCSKTAAQLFGEARVLSQTLGFDRTRTVAATVPGYHLYGLLFTLLVPLLSGARFVRPMLFQPSSIEDAIERYAVTDLITVPAHLRALIAVGTPLASLKRAVSSGAVLEPEVARAFACEVLDVLGSTESGGIAWRRSGSDSAYVPLPGVSVAVGPDERLLLSSPFLPNSSEAQLLNDRIRLVQGGFEHLGRQDGVIKLAGKRVATQEVEARALGLPRVSDAAVLVKPASTLRGAELWLALATSDPDLDEASVKRGLGEYFDAVVLPRRYRIVERLPRDNLGKLKREMLEGLFQSTSNAPPFEVLSLPEPSIERSGDEERFMYELLVPERWLFFEGHFPEEPIVPGVVQLSEIVLPSIASAWPELDTLDGASVLKYKRPIRPGETLALRVRRTLGTPNVHFEIRAAGEPASSGQLRFKLEVPRTTDF